MEGTPFGRYRLVELLGRGGMGEVWRAYDTAIDRVVALKVLPGNFANDKGFQARFRREARAAAGLDEPHVVPIHDFGDIDGRLYVTMRLIKGRDLQALLAKGPLPPPRAVGIIEQVASALHAAHTVGLVHRDVKPSNILLSDDDFAYLIDFGIARAADETALTSTGATVGTWAYMAPERFHTGTADARADVYSLACVLHECLTGQRPFPGNSLEQMAVAHMFTPPPRPSELSVDVPPTFDSVIATGMAKEPDERYSTTKDLAQAASAAVSTMQARRTDVSNSRLLTQAAPLPGTEPTTAGRSPYPPGVAPFSPTQPAATRHKNRLAEGESQPAEPRKRAWWRRNPIVVAAATGSILAVAVTAIAIALHDNSSTSSSSDSTSAPTAAPPFDVSQCKTGADANRIVGCRVIATGNSVDVAWTQLLGSRYTRPGMHLFTGAVNTECGPAADIGSFHCAADETVYVDIDFVQALVDQFGSTGGPLGVEYVVAHEYGHHVQNLLGDTGRTQTNAGEVERTELQADCYAGVWAHHGSAVQTWIQSMTDTQIRDFMSATASLGAQWQLRRDGGSLAESWLYSSANRRQHWFTIGYQSGDPKQCDTYGAASLGPA